MLTPPGWVVAVAEVPTDPPALGEESSNLSKRDELSEMVEGAVFKWGRDEIEEGVKLRDDEID